MRDLLKKKAPEKAADGGRTPEKAVVIVGPGYGALKMAEDMAKSGIPVVWVTGGQQFLELPRGPESFKALPDDLNHQFRPLYLRVTRHHLVTPLTRARVESVEESGEGLRVVVSQDPHYIDYDLCTGCAKCIEVCPLNDSAHPPLTRTPEYCPSRALELDKRRISPCRQACPLGVNVQAYMALTASGRYAEALAVIREANPLPGVCGRVCHHPCEAECRRSEIEEPLAIRDIKRFLFDHEAEKGEAAIAPPKKRRKERIAVVGSGPAGLTAAHFLNQHGFNVTVLESLPEAGGMLRAGINSFRLPRPVVDAEVKSIADSGVEIKTGQMVDDIAALFKEGYQAVLLATGTHCDLRLNIPGEDLEGVGHCVEFLEGVNMRGQGEVGREVVVIGGGNSAMDAARTALRLGAEKVTVVAIERGHELPASSEEVLEAREEGIGFKLGFAPLSFQGDKKIAGVEFRPAHWEFKDGRPYKIVYDSDETEVLAADTAIVTIGMRPDLDSCCLAEQIETGPGGRVSVDEALCTSYEGVFAAGDAVTGPSTIVGSMAGGREAANRIIEKLTGKASPYRRLDPGERGVGEWVEISEDVPRQPRQPMAQRQAKARRRDFDEVNYGLTAAQALAEAERCLQCGSCCECLACQTACEGIGAVDHFRAPRKIEISAPAVVVADTGELPAGMFGDSDLVFRSAKYHRGGDLMDVLVGATALAGQAMNKAHVIRREPFIKPPYEMAMEGPGRIGFFVCACNGSMAAPETLGKIRAMAEALPDVVHAQEIFSMCHPKGSDLMAKAVKDKNLSRVVMASCVCCPLEFQCISCNDQRTRAKMHLFGRLGLPRSRFETVNMRDSLLRGGASEEAILERARILIRDAFVRVLHLEPLRQSHTEIGRRVLILGGSEIGAAAAENLAGQGFEVRLVHRAYPSGSGIPDDIAKRPVAKVRGGKVKQVEEAEISSIEGDMGNFTARGVVNGRRRPFEADIVCLTDFNLIPLSISEDIQGLTKLYRHDFSFFHTPRLGFYRVMPRTLERVSGFEAGQALAAEVATAAVEAFLNDHQLSPTVDPELCRGCGRCEEICPFNAVTLDENPDGSYTARVVRHNCVGCGGCVGRCPVTALDMPYFSNQTLKEVLAGSLEGVR